MLPLDVLYSMLHILHKVFSKRAIQLQKLLKGISGNSKVTEHNWHFYAAGWLAVYFELDPKDNPMHNTERGCEAAAYAQLSAQLRCAPAFHCDVMPRGNFSAISSAKFSPCTACAIYCLCGTDLLLLV